MNAPPFPLLNNVPRSMFLFPLELGMQAVNRQHAAGHSTDLCTGAEHHVPKGHLTLVSQVNVSYLDIVLTP